MSVTLDIFRSYIRPRAMMRRRIGEGRREDRALAILMAACFLIFVAQLPRLAREAHLQPEIPLDARMGAALVGWMVIAPLFFYALAALSHFAARLLGGRGEMWRARMALFWALLASVPLWLLHGLVAGMIGPGPGLNLTGALLLAGFFFIWINGLIVAEREGVRA